MNTSNKDLVPLLKHNDLTLVKMHTGKQNDLPSLTDFTIDQWELEMPEGCKMLNSNEEYRKEVAKRQF